MTRVEQTTDDDDGEDADQPVEDGDRDRVVRREGEPGGEGLDQREHDEADAGGRRRAGAARGLLAAVL